MKPNGVTDPPGTNAVMEAYGWQTHRTLDEVRAAALHEAVQVITSGYLEGPPHRRFDHLLEVADALVRWLDGEERASLIATTEVRS
jgi:hypothetical protein